MSSILNGDNADRLKIAVQSVRLAKQCMFNLANPSYAGDPVLSYAVSEFEVALSHMAEKLETLASATKTLIPESDIASWEHHDHEYGQIEMMLERLAADVARKLR